MWFTFTLDARFHCCSILGSLICIWIVITFSFSLIFFDQTSDCKEVDVDFSLDDLETVKVIGKGSGGVVQLVQHKWVGKLFALKVVILLEQGYTGICFWSLYLCFQVTCTFCSVIFLWLYISWRICCCCKLAVLDLYI